MLVELAGATFANDVECRSSAREKKHLQRVAGSATRSDVDAGKERLAQLQGSGEV